MKSGSPGAASDVRGTGNSLSETHTNARAPASYSLLLRFFQNPANCLFLFCVAFSTPYSGGALRTTVL